MHVDCPYLDTVNRHALDFDFEKSCSNSSRKFNVYACLVCGKYYQGRGLNSHAYKHSLVERHHVFINLHDEKLYCLPDGYEINDPSLDDIRHVLNPKFTREQVQHLDLSNLWAITLDASQYLPGLVGLNNLKNTDFINVTIQALMRVTPLRDFFLIPENYQHYCNTPLVHCFGELTRKIWHARNFNGQVSPHELVQAVVEESGKQFQIGAQSDPIDFLVWLLNTLHKHLRRPKETTTIINQCFQGELEVVDDDHGGSENIEIVAETSKFITFLMVQLDLPSPPLFKDVMEKNIIPQVPIFNVLKFDGETVSNVVHHEIDSQRYRVTKLPPYVILHFRRFKGNNFFVEKNPMLVSFPIKHFELKDYVSLPTLKDSEQLRSKYNLVANIVHDGKPNEGSYRSFIQRKSEDQWYEVQDLHVSDTLPQMVALSEAYILVYELQ